MDMVERPCGLGTLLKTKTCPHVVIRWIQCRWRVIQYWSCMHLYLAEPSISEWRARELHVSPALFHVLLWFRFRFLKHSAISKGKQFNVFGITVWLARELTLQRLHRYTDSSVGRLEALIAQYLRVYRAWFRLTSLLHFHEICIIVIRDGRCRTYKLYSLISLSSTSSPRFVSILSETLNMNTYSWNERTLNVQLKTNRTL